MEHGKLQSRHPKTAKYRFKQVCDKFYFFPFFMRRGIPCFI